MNIFNGTKVISAVREKKDFEKALKAKPENIFLLSCNILELMDYISKAKEYKKRLFLHMDMTDGLGKDASAVEFISRLGFFGIISTRGNIIKHANTLGLCTVQRFFIVDSQSMKTALETVHQTKPTYAELMPGIAYKAIEEFAKEQTPVIAGGLINSTNDAACAFSAGATAVSTSEYELWES